MHISPLPVLILALLIVVLTGCGGSGGGSNTGTSTEPDDTTQPDTGNDQKPPQESVWEISHEINNADSNGDTGYFKREHWDMDVRDDGTVLTAWEFVLSSVIGTPTDIGMTRYTPGEGWGAPEGILQNIDSAMSGRYMRISTDDPLSETLSLQKSVTSGNYLIYEHTLNNDNWYEAGTFKLTSNNDPRIEESANGSMMMSAPVIYDGGVNHMQSYFTSGSLSETSLERIYPITYKPKSDVDLKMLRDNIHLDENGVTHAFYPSQREPVPYTPRPSDDPVMQYSQALHYKNRRTDGAWDEPEELAITDLAVNTESILLNFSSAVSPNGEHAAVVWIEKLISEKHASSNYNMYVLAKHDGVWAPPKLLYSSDAKYSYGRTTIKPGIDRDGNILVAFLPSDANLLVSVYTPDDASWSVLKDVSGVHSKRLTHVELFVLSPPVAGPLIIITKELVGTPSKATQGLEQNKVTDYLVSRSFDPITKLLTKKVIIRKNYETNAYLYQSYKGINDRWKADMDADGNTYVLWAYDADRPILGLNISKLATQ